MSDLHTLYQVQVFELRVDAARQRLDEIENILNNDEQVTKAQHAFELAQKTLQELRALSKDLDLESASLTTKISDVNDLLYGGSIKNPKELKDRQDELAMLERQRLILEERMLETASDLETAETELVTSEEHLKTLTAERAEESTNLTKERDDLNNEIKTTLRKRKSMIKDIPKPLAKQFRALRKTRKQAISRLNGNSCEVCAIEQPSSEIQRILTTDDTIKCVGCGRILINP